MLFIAFDAAMMPMLPHAAAADAYACALMRCCAA